MKQVWEYIFEVLVNLFFWAFSVYYNLPLVVISGSIIIILVLLVMRSLKTTAPLPWRRLRYELPRDFGHVLILAALVTTLITGIIQALILGPHTAGNQPPTPTSTPTPASRPTATRILLLPSFPTYTPTPSPTATSTPTETPTFTPTASPSPTYTYTPKPPRPPDPPSPGDPVPDVPESCFSEALQISRIEPNAHSISRGADIRIWGTALNSPGTNFDQFVIEYEISSMRPPQNHTNSWRGSINIFYTVTDGLLATWNYMDWQRLLITNGMSATQLDVWIRVRGVITSTGNGQSMRDDCFVKLRLNR